MKRKCGQTRQSNSDTTARPMRHVSDTKKFLSATTVADPATNARHCAAPLLLERSLSQCDPIWPATTMSQMSHSSDTKNAFFSYEECVIPDTDRPHLRPPLSYKSPAFQSHRCGIRLHKSLPPKFPTPAAAIAQDHIHSTPSSSWSLAGTLQTRHSPDTKTTFPATTGVESSYGSPYTLSWPHPRAFRLSETPYPSLSVRPERSGMARADSPSSHAVEGPVLSPPKDGPAAERPPFRPNEYARPATIERPFRLRSILTGNG